MTIPMYRELTIEENATHFILKVGCRFSIPVRKGTGNVQNYSLQKYDRHYRQRLKRALRKNAVRTRLREEHAKVMQALSGLQQRARR